MKTSKAIVWIDDDPRRGRTATDIGARFINVRRDDGATELESFFDNPAPPSLVILDHMLDKAKIKNRLFQRGSTIAEAIKEKWPSCPVVGVTNATLVKNVNVRTRRAYDAFFSFANFGKHIRELKSIERGFALIAKADVRAAESLVKRLKPPHEEIKRLVAVLPDDLQEAFGDQSVASRLYTWVSRLIRRPGFLYDALWSATALGLTMEGFRKVEDRFAAAKYTGIFVCDDQPRWWSSRLTEVLYDLCKPEHGELSWHCGRRLAGITPQDFSRCYVCDDELPETVAYVDAASDERFPMHLRCTVLHPHYKRELYFEDIRMMQPH
jgi:hypothetical protein